MKTIVEKPSTPVSKLANIGLYYVKDWKTLFDGIAHVLEQPPGKGGEYYLTDAFQYMVDRGRRLYTAPVGGWYDCGKVETLLETNRHLLEQGRARIPQGPCPSCTIVPPVYIEDGVTIHDATVGPNVSLEAGSYVTESTIANSVLGKNVRVVRSAVRDSLVGDDQVIEGKTIERSVLDGRSEEHTSELQSQSNLVCRLLLEKKNAEEHTDPVLGRVDPPQHLRAL